MQKQVQIKDIPVRPHVRAFLIGEFGAEPIIAHTKNIIGSTVVLVAQKLPYELAAAKLVAATSSIKIKLPLSLKHYKITPQKADKLGYAFEKLFQLSLVQFIKGQVAYQIMKAMPSIPSMPSMILTRTITMWSRLESAGGITKKRSTKEECGVASNPLKPGKINSILFKK